jgi:hypothetical protein
MAYDKAQRRNEVSATITEAAAEASETTEALREGGLPVTTAT